MKFYFPTFFKNFFIIFICLLKNSRFKIKIRRALIICFSFEEVYESEYVLEDSFVCEIIIEKLIYYFLLSPQAFELENKDFVLDIAYNIKQTFPSIYKKYFDFWDYIYFINKFFNTIRCLKLKERLKLLFFNNFLLKYLQERLCSCNLKVIRSTLQYVILMLTLINDQDIINLIYNFIFGFSDSKTNYVFTYNTEKETSFMAETLINSNTNSNANIPNSTEKQYKNDLKNSGKKNSISYTHSRTNSINSVLSKNFNLQSDNNENMISNSNNNYGGLNTLNTFSNSSSNNNSASKNNNNSAYKNQVSSNNPDTYANNNSYNNYDSKYNQKSNPEYLSTKNSEI